MSRGLEYGGFPFPQDKVDRGLSAASSLPDGKTKVQGASLTDSSKNQNKQRKNSIELVMAGGGGLLLGRGQC